VKRPSLKDRADVTALLRGSEPADARPATQSTGLPSGRVAGKTVSRQRTMRRPGAAKTSSEEPLIKATFYLSAADLQTLDSARIKRRAETGRRRGVDLSALVREAIRTRFGR
jgi:hypothetical protein